MHRRNQLSLSQTSFAKGFQTQHPLWHCLLSEHSLPLGSRRVVAPLVGVTAVRKLMMVVSGSRGLILGEVQVSRKRDWIAIVGIALLNARYLVRAREVFLLSCSRESTGPFMDCHCSWLCRHRRRLLRTSSNRCQILPRATKSLCSHKELNQNLGRARETRCAEK